MTVDFPFSALATQGSPQRIGTKGKGRNWDEPFLSSFKARNPTTPFGRRRTTPWVL
jgi:hypothetical protein